MCGIAGSIGEDRWSVEAAVGAATSALAHRGPDAAGQVTAPFGSHSLSLGHRRLSILDLSHAGQQPMMHAASGALIVFNGEIYNFRRLRAVLELAGDRFETGTDTEVLLAGLVRHGESFLTKLEGMFALAFFDPRSSELLLARDPAGIKPLHIAEAKGNFLFASEMRAIRATGLLTPKMDRAAVAGFLAYGAVQQPLTLYEGVRALSPGSALTIRVGKDAKWERKGPPTFFWRLPEWRSDITIEHAISDVRQTLDAAVRDHLIADVPVGLFLSSGLDSTIIAALAARHTRELQSFTVVFEDHLDFSEGQLAAQTASRLGLRHTEIPISMEAAESAVADWLTAMDQPSIDGLNVFVISRAVREQGIKVALSGLGADELFGGYPSFRDVPRLRRITRVVRSMPRGLRRAVARAATLRQAAVARGKLGDMFASDGSIRSLCLHRRRLMSDQQLESFGLSHESLRLGPDYLPDGALHDVDAKGPNADLTRLVSQLEFRQYQGNMLLPDADVYGMASGLEIRVPFLDRRLLDYVHVLAGSVRLPVGAPGKYLLRAAFSDLLPAALISQPKRGFTLPIRRWMLGTLRSQCESAMDALKISGLLIPRAVEEVWEAFLAEPESPAWSRAFALVVLGKFCKGTAA